MASTPESRADLMQHIAEEEEAEDRKSGASLGNKRRYDEFECPTCSAYNPHDTFGNGEEVSCAYCGLPFTVLIDEDGRLKLREA